MLATTFTPTVTLAAFGNLFGLDTLVIFLIIKFTVGLRVDAEEETVGLDETSHGERAYNS